MDSKTYILECMQKIGIQQAKILQDKAPSLSGTEIIDDEVFIPDFNPDKQYLNKNIGFVVRYDNQVWKLAQSYDSTIYRDPPGTRGMEAFWGIVHTKDPYKAKPFIKPLGTVGMYMKDECCIENDKIYKSLNDNNVYSPSEYQQGWKLIEI